jgi:ribonuclease VapC
VIVDTSALIAILRAEPEAPAIGYALADSPDNRLSAASHLEAAIVAMRRDVPSLERKLDELVREADIAVEPVTETQARIAATAYREYGKGSGHRAGLNYGDCFAYALAVDRDELLLCRGDGFVHTDLRVVALT